MCGIAGIALTDLEGRVDRGLLEAMAGAIAHRGPDGEGFLAGPGVGLASRRLAVIDPEGGAQPLTNEDGRVACVYNGEIYNFAELRSGLEERGHRFRSRTDGEILCHLYEEEGEGMLPLLRGMFAFALWDARRGRLLLARDRFGIKPLYWARVPGGLAFASELKALLRLPGVSRDLDPVALSDYLTYLYVPAPRTILAGASKLPPGTRLTFQGGREEVAPWWEPPPPGRGESLPPEEAARELLARLRETVRAHLVADVPVGAFLSGGLDSSTVVALMAEASPSPVRTFTVGFEGAGAYDERPAARAVARRFGCLHHETVLTPGRAMELLPGLVRTFGEPFADSSAIPTYIVSELAARELPVVLSGDGGDELLCGYDWYRYHQLLRPVSLVPGRVRQALGRAAAAGLPELGRVVGGPARARRLAADAGLDPRGRYLRRITCFGEPVLARLLAARAEGSGVAARWYASLPEPAGPIERMAYADLRLGLPEDMLTKVDRASMAHGLEVRVPFLDPELAAFVWALPTRLKLRGVGTKWLLRRALEGILPPSTLTRRKQGFGVPIGRWLREDSASWRPLLLGSRAVAEGYLRAAPVETIVERHLSARQELGHQVWALLVLEVWFRGRTEGGELPGDLVLADLA
jgi:asparagine synthase (glutamine-hydrolysing)